MSGDADGRQFQDARLGRRFQRLVRQLETRLGHSIPLACQDWTNMKAAYRFLANRRVSKGPILAGHFQATRDRVAAVPGSLRITVIHARSVTNQGGRERIDWKLITTLAVRSRKDALEKLCWYAMRSKIETFHKILKSSCKLEASKLRTGRENRQSHRLGSAFSVGVFSK